MNIIFENWQTRKIYTESYGYNFDGTLKTLSSKSFDTDM